MHNVFYTALFAAAVTPQLLQADDMKTAYWQDQGANAVAARAQQAVNTRQAKNIILLIGDGMSIATLTAGRIYEGQQQNRTGEEHLLSFETFPYTALVRTYNVDAQIPDSAGTATAFSSGVKSRMGVINTGPEQPYNQCAGQADHALLSSAAYAERAGMATGVISTARITHATPATVYAVAASREWESDSDLPEEARRNGCADIASQLLSFPHGDGLDIALGGGRKNFLPQSAGGARGDQRDLTRLWQQRQNARYIENRQQLLALPTDTSDPVLGLFSDSHLPYHADRNDNDPSLSELTEFAIKKLSHNKNGFFLMVEAGRIDHAHHGGNGARALEDTAELSRTVAKILQLVNTDETLILVTADHSHVMSMAGYTPRGNPILGLSNGADGKPNLAADGKPYTTLGYQNGPGAVQGERTELNAQNVAALDFRQQALVPLESETHGGEDVALHAIGPWAHLVRGTIQQNEIFHIIDYAAGLKRRAAVPATDR